MTPLPPIAARRPRRVGLPSSLALAVLLGGLASPGARAQPVDMTKGGPVEVTSTNGIEWRQAEQVVIATGNAKAVRDGVTLNDGPTRLAEVEATSADVDHRLGRVIDAVEGMLTPARALR